MKQFSIAGVWDDVDMTIEKNIETIIRVILISQCYFSYVRQR